MASDTGEVDFLALTAQIVSAHVSHNATPAAELPALIQSIHAALVGFGNAAPAEASRAEPAVPIKKSVFPDYIICLEDGKKLKLLKRHLQMAYAMTPDQYRVKWGLSADYPFVAANFAKHRSALSKRTRVGSKAADRATKLATEAVKLPANRKIKRPRKTA